MFDLLRLLVINLTFFGNLGKFLMLDLTQLVQLV